VKDVDDRAISGNVIVTENENAGVNAKRMRRGRRLVLLLFVGMVSLRSKLKQSTLDMDLVWPRQW
jgi:hypothetical protein